MCAEALNRGGLSAGLLARDFGTTVFPGGLCRCVSAMPWQGTELQRAGCSPGPTFRKAGPSGPAFRFTVPAAQPERVPASTAMTVGQARLRGSMRSKWPAPGISTSVPPGNARLISTGTWSSALP